MKTSPSHENQNIIKIQKLYPLNTSQIICYYYVFWGEIAIKFKFFQQLNDKTFFFFFKSLQVSASNKNNYY